MVVLKGTASNVNDELKKKRMIVVLLLVIGLTLVIGATYAYFSATILNGDRASNIRINTAVLGLSYSEEALTCVMEGMLPGTSCTHKFYIENTGTAATDYYVYFIEVINTFVTQSDLVYSVTCQAVNTEVGNKVGECLGKSETIVPEDEELIINQNIEVGITHEYIMTITFKETGINQNDNQGKIFGGKILVTNSPRPLPVYTWAKASTNGIDDIVIDLEPGMIPIALIDETDTWYDYANQKWANMILVTEESRSKYQSASVGKKIKEEDILAYFVWIPRYKYKLWNAESEISDVQEIMIEFENKTNPKSTGNVNGTWLTHPAFTFGDTEVSGIWVGKFEISPDPETECFKNSSGCNKKEGITPRIVSNVSPWKGASLSTFFDIAQMFKTDFMYGISSTTVDSHMMKNMEWGAVAYLSHSKYGKYGNENYTGPNKEIYINNYRKDATSQATLTGCSSGAPSAGISSSCAYTYPSIDIKATGASTSGTIYGIYDMSGGGSEYVMGNMATSSGNFFVSTAGIFTNGTPAAKYYDNYVYGTSTTDSTRGKLGDATNEMLKNSGTTNGNWYSDETSFPANSYSWFTRGGHPSSSAASGIFGFYGRTGSSNGTCTTRAVLLSE